MFRRSLMFAVASLFLLGAAPIDAHAQPAAPLAVAHQSDDYGFPAALGGFRRQDVRTSNEGVLYVRYATRTASFQIAIAELERGGRVPDGCDADWARRMLSRLDEGVRSDYEDQGTEYRVVREAFRVAVGEGERGWTWIGNSYEYMHPEFGPMQRVDLVNGFAGRVMVVTIHRRIDDANSQAVSAAVRDLSILLHQSSRPANRGEVQAPSRGPATGKSI
jgi:hypothetical protein